jgi:hypothetical protein
MNHNKLTLIIFFIAYPIYLDISIEEDVNLIAAIVTVKRKMEQFMFYYFIISMVRLIYLNKKQS